MIAETCHRSRHRCNVLLFLLALQYLTSVSDRLDGQVDTESLEVDNDEENNNGSQEIHQIWQVGSVEGFIEGTNFIILGGQKVEKGNDGTFEFSTTTDIDCSWRECFPDDSFTDIGCNEKRDTRSKTVTLGKKFVKKQNNESSNKKLDNDQTTDTSSHLSWITVHTSQYIDNSLTKSHNHTEKFLGTRE